MPKNANASAPPASVNSKSVPAIPVRRKSRIMTGQSRKPRPNASRCWSRFSACSPPARGAAIGVLVGLVIAVIIALAAPSVAPVGLVVVIITGIVGYVLGAVIQSQE